MSKIWLVLLLVLATPILAGAHPGRLDEHGCHWVRHDYTYHSGEVLKAGSYHCHRALDQMRLDGSHLIENTPDLILVDPDEPERPKDYGQSP